MEKRFGVVSADGHCRLMHLPFDLWTKRLPKKFQDNAPRIVTGPDSTRQYCRRPPGGGRLGWRQRASQRYTQAGSPEEPSPASSRRQCAVSLRYGPRQVDAELVNSPYEISRRDRNCGRMRSCRQQLGAGIPESHGRFMLRLSARHRRGRRGADAGGRVWPADRGHLHWVTPPTGASRGAGAAAARRPAGQSATQAAGRARWGGVPA